MRFRLLAVVIRRSGASRVVAWFLTVYLVCAGVVMVAEPGVERYVDALWFLWEVATTVGLGDMTAVTLLGRAATILCSIHGIVTVAIITAVIVDFFNECRHAQLDESKTLLLDRLEHLDELSKDELRDISAKIRRLRQ